MIVKDRKRLSKPCEYVDNIEDGENLAAELFKELANSKTGMGLAANQIGINKRVCVINVKEPLFFINPKITNTSGSTNTYESCLSFPKKRVRTKRFTEITVEADNLTAPVVFSGDTGNEIDLLESICIQHEIDHLLGITMYDRADRQEPIVNKTKIGRNQKVIIKRKDEIKTIKWKKAEPLLKDGWALHSTDI